MRKGGLETLLKNYAEGGEAKLAEGIADFMNDKIGIEVPIEQVVEKDEKGNDKIVKNQLRLKPPGLREFTINLSTNTPTEIIQGLQYAIIGDPDLLRSANIGTEQSLFPNSAAKNLIQRIRLEKKEEEENN
jgi:hypothetical protein